MTWNYRVIRHPDGSHAVHEVYYDENGRPKAATVRPVSLTIPDDAEFSELIWMLETALKDAKERPVLAAEEIPGYLAGAGAE